MLLCVIYVFSKYALVKPLTVKKGKTVLNAFIETVNESMNQTNQINYGLIKEENFTINICKNG